MALEDFADGFVGVGDVVSDFFGLKSGRVGFLDEAIAVWLQLPVLVALPDPLDLDFVETDGFHDVVQRIGQLLFLFDGQQAVVGGDFGLVFDEIDVLQQSSRPMTGEIGKEPVDIDHVAFPGLHIRMGAPAIFLGSLDQASLHGISGDVFQQLIEIPGVGDQGLDTAAAVDSAGAIVFLVVIFAVGGVQALDPFADRGLS